MMLLIYGVSECSFPLVVKGKEDFYPSFRLEDCFPEYCVPENKFKSELVFT